MRAGLALLVAAFTLSAFAAGAAGGDGSANISDFGSGSSSSSSDSSESGLPIQRASEDDWWFEVWNAMPLVKQQLVRDGGFSSAGSGESHRAAPVRAVSGSCVATKGLKGVWHCSHQSYCRCDAVDIGLKLWSLCAQQQQQQEKKPQNQLPSGVLQGRGLPHRRILALNPGTSAKQNAYSAVGEEMGLSNHLSIRKQKMSNTTLSDNKTHVPPAEQQWKTLVASSYRSVTPLHRRILQSCVVVPQSSEVFYSRFGKSVDSISRAVIRIEDSPAGGACEDFVGSRTTARFITPSLIQHYLTLAKTLDLSPSSRAGTLLFPTLEPNVTLIFSANPPQYQRSGLSELLNMLKQYRPDVDVVVAPQANLGKPLQRAIQHWFGANSTMLPSVYIMAVRTALEFCSQVTVLATPAAYSSAEPAYWYYEPLQERKPADNIMTGMEERTFLAVIAQLTKRISFFKGPLAPLIPSKSRSEPLVRRDDAVPFPPKDLGEMPSNIADRDIKEENNSSEPGKAKCYRYSLLDTVTKYHRENHEVQDNREHSSRDKRVRFVLSLSALEERFSKKPQHPKEKTSRERVKPVKVAHYGRRHSDKDTDAKHKDSSEALVYAAHTQIGRRKLSVSASSKEVDEDDAANYVAFNFEEIGELRRNLAPPQRLRYHRRLSMAQFLSRHRPKELLPGLENPVADVSQNLHKGTKVPLVQYDQLFERQAGTQKPGSRGWAIDNDYEDIQGAQADLKSHKEKQQDASLVSVASPSGMQQPSPNKTMSIEGSNFQDRLSQADIASQSPALLDAIHKAAKSKKASPFNAYNSLSPQNQIVLVNSLSLGGSGYISTVPGIEKLEKVWSLQMLRGGSITDNRGIFSGSLENMLREHKAKMYYMQRARSIHQRLKRRNR